MTEMEIALVTIFIVASLVLNRWIVYELDRIEARYAPITDNIINRIIGLNKEYPHFIAIEERAEKSGDLNITGIALRYNHAVKWVPNSQFKQWIIKKIDTKIQLFSETEGISLNIVFTTRVWLSQYLSKSIKIGSLKVFSSIKGAETEVLELIRLSKMKKKNLRKNTNRFQ